MIAPTDKENQSFYSNCSNQSIDLEDILKPQLLINPLAFYHLPSSQLFLPQPELALLQQDKLNKSNEFNTFLQLAINFNFQPLLTYSPQPQSISQITLKSSAHLHDMLHQIQSDKLFYFSAKISQSRSFYGFIESLYITTSNREYVLSFQKLNQYRAQIQPLFSDQNIVKCAYQNQKTVWLLYYHYNIITFNYLDLSTLPKSQFDNSVYNSMWIKLIELIRSYPQGVLNMNIMQNAENLRNQIFQKQSETNSEDILKESCQNYELLHRLIIWRKKVAKQEDEDENFILTNQSLISVVKSQQLVNVKEKYKDSILYLMSKKSDPCKWAIQKNNLKVNLEVVKDKLIYDDLEYANGGNFQSQTVLEGMKQHLEQALEYEDLEAPIKLEDLLQNNQLSAKNLQKLQRRRNTENEEEDALKFAKGVIKIVNARTDRKQSARLCDGLIDQVQGSAETRAEEEEQELEHQLNHLDSMEVDFKALPSSFDEYIQDLVPVKQMQCKKKKKQKLEDFRQEDMKQLENFVSSL